MKVFLDINVLVYASSDGPSALLKGDSSKRNLAVELLDCLGKIADIAISAQVMSEYFVVATREARRFATVPLAALALTEMKNFEVVSIDRSLVLLAVDRSAHNQISYWDALIVEAALRAGAELLYTEDLQHGMKFGSMLVVNPFLIEA